VRGPDDGDALPCRCPAALRGADRRWRTPLQLCDDLVAWLYAVSLATSSTPWSSPIHGICAHVVSLQKERLTSVV
jgi:hypothetical protein